MDIPTAMASKTLVLLRLAIALPCAGLLGAVLLFLIGYHRLHTLKIEGQDFVQTLRQIPLAIPLAIDLLDLGLDFLGAPLGWFILGRLGLGALRNVAVLEQLVPGTQLLPLMTLCWLGVRVYDLLRRWRAQRR